MKSNVGSTDRTLRAIIGIVVLALGYYYSSWWGLLGLIPLGTALFSRCALYSVFGISTRKTEEKAIETQATSRNHQISDPPNFFWRVLLCCFLSTYRIAARMRSPGPAGNNTKSVWFTVDGEVHFQKVLAIIGDERYYRLYFLAQETRKTVEIDKFY